MRAVLVARSPGVLAGRLAAAETFGAVDPAIVVNWAAADGDRLEAGQVLAASRGRWRRCSPPSAPPSICSATSPAWPP